MQIEIPILEKISTNRVYSGLHWTERNRIKDLYHTYVKLYVKNDEQLKFPVRCTYSFIWHKRSLDASNCTFMLKLLEDGLVNAGILPDDSIDYVSEIKIINTLDKTQKEDRVRIMIESL